MRIKDIPHKKTIGTVLTGTAATLAFVSAMQMSEPNKMEEFYGPFKEESLIVGKTDDGSYVRQFDIGPKRDVNLNVYVEENTGVPADIGLRLVQVSQSPVDEGIAKARYTLPKKKNGLNRDLTVLKDSESKEIFASLHTHGYAPKGDSGLVGYVQSFTQAKLHYGFDAGNCHSDTFACVDVYVTNCTGFLVPLNCNTTQILDNHAPLSEKLGLSIPFGYRNFERDRALGKLDDLQAALTLAGMTDNLKLN